MFTNHKLNFRLNKTYKERMIERGNKESKPFYKEWAKPITHDYVVNNNPSPLHYRNGLFQRKFDEFFDEWKQRQFPCKTPFPVELFIIKHPSNILDVLIQE